MSNHTIIMLLFSASCRLASAQPNQCYAFAVAYIIQKGALEGFTEKRSHGDFTSLEECKRKAAFLKKNGVPKPASASWWGSWAVSKIGECQICGEGKKAIEEDRRDLAFESQLADVLVSEEQMNGYLASLKLVDATKLKYLAAWFPQNPFFAEAAKASYPENREDLLSKGMVQLFQTASKTYIERAVGLVGFKEADWGAFLLCSAAYQLKHCLGFQALEPPFELAGIATLEAIKYMDLGKTDDETAYKKASVLAAMSYTMQVQGKGEIALKLQTRALASLHDSGQHPRGIALTQLISNMKGMNPPDSIVAAATPKPASNSTQVFAGTADTAFAKPPDLTKNISGEYLMVGNEGCPSFIENQYQWENGQSTVYRDGTKFHSKLIMFVEQREKQVIMTTRYFTESKNSNGWGTTEGVSTFSGILENDVIYAQGEDKVVAKLSTGRQSNLVHKNSMLVNILPDGSIKLKTLGADEGMANCSSIFQRK